MKTLRMHRMLGLRTQKKNSHINEWKLLFRFMSLQLMKGVLGRSISGWWGKPVFSGCDDWLMWLNAGNQESSPNSAVFVGQWFFRLRTMTYLALRVKIKYLYDTSFYYFFCMYSLKSVFIIFQMLVNINIQGNICFLWHAMHVTVAFFKSILFLCALTSFKNTEIYFYMCNGYLYKNFFKFIIFCCLLCADFYYSISFVYVL